MNERRRAIEISDAIYRRITESFQVKKRLTLAARIDPGVALAQRPAEQEEQDGSD